MKLSREERKKLGDRLYSEIEASDNAKGELPERWRENEATYECSRSAIGVQIIPGNQGNDLPFWQPKADRIVATVIDQLTALFPAVQCIDETAQGQNLQAIELALQTLADRGHFFERELPPTIYDALNTNCGTLRVSPTKDAEGRVNGFEFISIHPRYMMAYPCEVPSFDKCSSVGHRFDLRVWEVKELIEDGVYDELPKGTVFGGDLPMGDEDDERDWSSHGENLTNVTSTISHEDDAVELWEILTKAKLGKDKRRRWYKCVLMKDGAHLLSCEPYGAMTPTKIKDIVEDEETEIEDADDQTEEVDYEEYPEVWYVDFRTKPDRYTVWPSWSAANVAQVIQNEATQLVETCIQGTYYSAVPTVIATGGSLPAKNYTLTPGEILSINADVKITELPNSFREGMAEPMIQLLSELLDASTGISRLGTSQTLPASTSATAAAGFLQAQNEAKGAYADQIAPSIEKVWRIMFWLMQFHAEDILETNKNRIPKMLTPKFIKSSSVRFEVTGTDPAATPNTLIQKIQFAMQLVQGNPAFDYNKFVQHILDYLDFPFDTSSLLKPEPKLNAQLYTALRAQGYTDSEIATQLGLLELAKQAQMAGTQQMPFDAQQAMQQQGPQQGQPPAQPGQPMMGGQNTAPNNVTRPRGTPSQPSVSVPPALLNGAPGSVQNGA